MLRSRRSARLVLDVVPARSGTCARRSGPTPRPAPEDDPAGAETWIHFDSHAAVDAAAWSELEKVFDALREQGGHGQVTVHLGGALKDSAMDVAVYLEQMIPNGTRVLDLGSADLLVFKPPRRLGLGPGSVGVREPRRPPPSSDSGSVAADPPNDPDY